VSEVVFQVREQQLLMLLLVMQAESNTLQNFFPGTPREQLV
jgi:hypothetical protein